VCVIALVAVTGIARADDTRPVTLAEVVAAVSSSPAAPIAKYEADAADANVDAAGAWPAPSAHVETNRLTARLVTGVVIPLPILGTVGALRDEAAARARVAHRDAVVSSRDLERRAVLAWIALARADADIEVHATAAKQAADLERIVRGRLDAGTGAVVDVTTASAARARADVVVSSTKRAQQAAAAELAGVLGWDPTRSLASSGPLPGGSAVELDALRARLADHPERAAALARVTAAEATVARVRTGRLPALSIEGQVSFHDPTTPGTDVMGGLVLELPLFSHVGDQIRASVATAAAERSRAGAAEAELAGALVAAYRRWQAAGETVAALDHDVVPAQQHAAELARQAYREGSRDLATALTAERDLAGVRADLVAARGDLATAWIELQIAAGEEPGHAR
jgi:cobalt-zinc-cadmium efflux system outer membrane protein